MKKSYKHIIFDFDGVLVESNEIRFEGFRELFKDFPNEKVEPLIEYCRVNGGISRYQKIRYFFEEILKKPGTDNEVNSLAAKYSQIVKKQVVCCKPVKGAFEFLSRFHKKYDFAVVSASDQNELRQICRQREISQYFVEILGSPIIKEENISYLVGKKGWSRESVLFIGDSINDFHAVLANGINFLGRNSGLIDWSTVDNVPFVQDLSHLSLQLRTCLRSL